MLTQSFSLLRSCLVSPQYFPFTHRLRLLCAKPQKVAMSSWRQLLSTITMFRMRRQMPARGGLNPFAFASAMTHSRGDKIPLSTAGGFGSMQLRSWRVRRCVATSFRGRPRFDFFSIWSAAGMVEPVRALPTLSFIPYMARSEWGVRIGQR